MTLLSDRRAGHRLRHHLLLVARMMMGLHFRRTCRSRRSTSTAWFAEERARDVGVEGNVIDPLGVIDGLWRRRCALRWRALGATLGTTSSCPRNVETNRNFATKLWNACRFAGMGGCAQPPEFDPPARRRR
jgi:valyl-tRNA synthetase